MPVLGDALDAHPSRLPNPGGKPTARMRFDSAVRRTIIGRRNWFGPHVDYLCAAAELGPRRNATRTWVVAAQAHRGESDRRCSALLHPRPPEGPGVRPPRRINQSQV